VKMSSVNSGTGQLKCCQMPKVLTNFTSTVLAPSWRAISITLFGLLILSPLTLIFFHLLLVQTNNPLQVTALGGD